VYLGLLDGRFHALSEEQITAALLQEPRPEDTPADTPAENTGARDDDPATADAASHADADRAPDAAADPAAPDPAAPDPAGADDCNPDRAARTGIEIRVGLATLLGLDEHPGEIPGLGPVLAEVARAIVARQVRGAEWRFAVTDPDGYLLLAGITRHRPRSPQPPDHPGAPRHGGIVELQMTATQLTQLAQQAGTEQGPAEDWAGVVADLTAQFARRDTLLAALDTRPHDRFPHTALARHIQVRDRTCSHPGCRRPARRSDLDHTRDHARGGTTVQANLGPGCKRHHLYKHQLGWRLAQPQPGTFVWTSPLGQVYRTRGEPITPPLPEPRPRPREPDLPDTGHAWVEGPILRLPDPPAQSEARPPPPPPPPVDPDEPPPF
jgi:hypothetical protein